jgi:hypothetical protein
MLAASFILAHSGVCILTGQLLYHGEFIMIKPLFRAHSAGDIRVKVTYCQRKAEIGRHYYIKIIRYIYWGKYYTTYPNHRL